MNQLGSIRGEFQLICFIVSVNKSLSHGVLGLEQVLAKAVQLTDDTLSRIDTNEQEWGRGACCTCNFVAQFEADL